MQMILDREALHRIPELDKNLGKTFAYLRQQLQSLNCVTFMPTQCCLCAYFDFGKESALAFRADADGLPLQEQTGLSFASEHPGQMHACGHDGHMAMVLDLARFVSGRANLNHNILLIFQGAEETTGGAKELCETDLLQKYNVKAVFGMHLWPGLQKGGIFSCPGPMMSRSCEVTVQITGKSAHIAKAEEGIDALAAGVEFYRQATALLHPDTPGILRFGKMESGSVRNALSGQTRLEGTLRTFREETFAALKTQLLLLGEKIAAQSGCKVDVHISEGYPAVDNDPALLQAVQQIAPVQLLDRPSLITEDFSWYQRYARGVFFFLGIGNTPALHAADFDFDPAVLPVGAAFFRQLAENLNLL